MRSARSAVTTAGQKTGLLPPVFDPYAWTSCGFSTCPLAPFTYKTTKRRCSICHLNPVPCLNMVVCRTSNIYTLTLYSDLYCISKAGVLILYFLMLLDFPTVMLPMALKFKGFYHNDYHGFRTYKRVQNTGA